MRERVLESQLSLPYNPKTKRGIKIKHKKPLSRTSLVQSDESVRWKRFVEKMSFEPGIK